MRENYTLLSHFIGLEDAGAYGDSPFHLGGSMRIEPRMSENATSAMSIKIYVIKKAKNHSLLTIAIVGS